MNYLVYVLTALFILAGAIVSLGRYWQYEVFYYDFGIFDRAIWLVAHFKPPIVDHLIIGGKWIFADHFHPSIFLFSPLYWFTDKQEILLIAQATVVGLAGLVIYFTGIKVLKDKFASLAVLISFFLFIGLQNAVITDFHEATIATLSLALTFWAIINKKLKWLIIFGLIFLGFKESNFLSGVVLGIFIVLLNRKSNLQKTLKDKWVKIGILTSIFCFIYGLFVIKILIPYFSGGIYIYADELTYEPTRFITTFFDQEAKIDTMYKTFLSFSFLPVLAPNFWLLILEDFWARFFAWRSTITLHYSALVSVIMAVASIYSLKFLNSKIKNKLIFRTILIVVILNSIFHYRFVYHGPLALSYNPAFYRHSGEFEFLDKMVRMIPKDASVMAQNNISPHFTHHRDVFLLRMKYEELKPDYVVIDARGGQSINNFLSTQDFGLEKFLKKISNDKNYKLIYKTDEQYIFKKVL